VAVGSDVPRGKASACRSALRRGGRDQSRNESGKETQSQHRQISTRRQTKHKGGGAANVSAALQVPGPARLWRGCWRVVAYGGPRLYAASGPPRGQRGERFRRRLLRGAAARTPEKTAPRPQKLLSRSRRASALRCMCGDAASETISLVSFQHPSVAGLPDRRRRWLPPGEQLRQANSLHPAW